VHDSTAGAASTSRHRRLGRQAVHWQVPLLNRANRRPTLQVALPRTHTDAPGGDETGSPDRA
jgi:hypothetical protein